MKKQAVSTPAAQGRRRLFAGAATVGAAAAAAALLPHGDQPEAQGADARPGDDAQGYRVTDHVRRYYRTARI